MAADLPRVPPEPAVRDGSTIRAALSGDRAAGERLAARLVVVPRMLAAIDARRGRRLSSHDLEDLTQDVLVRVWGKLDLFGGTGTLEAWLYRFCLNEYMNRVRSLSRGPQLSADLEVPSSSSGPADGVDGDLLERLLQRLGPPEEDVVRLKHFEDLTFTGVGERLGMSPNTAKTRYYRAIQWLRERLSGRAEGAS